MTAAKARPPAAEAPVSPVTLPPGRVVHLPGRGETFVRDTGGTGPVVLLLHGWMFSADTNFYPSYEVLHEAGYRVLAIDHRGHGRGLRSLEPFRLKACADDAAALLDALDIDSAHVVGYSMGGPIAQLLARDHPDLVVGLVCCATSSEWRDPRSRAVWTTMGVVRLVLGLFPYGIWRRIVPVTELASGSTSAWVGIELTRGSSRDIAEAGRELGRFDSHAWLASLRVPSAVVLTTKDELVAPRKQRALARYLGAPTFEVVGDHSAIALVPDAFNKALLAALSDVARRSDRTDNSNSSSGLGSTLTSAGARSAPASVEPQAEIA